MIASLPAPPAPSNERASRPDFLSSLARSGILTARQFERVRTGVDGGLYPAGSMSLARELIAERTLTEYQARHVLHRGGAGLVLGRYVILDRLGRGSMGRVYRALHRPMGRVVALKVIDPDVACRRGALARFRREMQLVGRLDHPNVVRAFDADRVGSVPYIAMEYLRGRSLDQISQAAGPLPPGDVANYARQAALGLAHAHARGVVHRDVKPSNLMVGRSGELKILDFGVGTIAGTRPGDAAPGLTADGLTVGTVEYMSPEQAAGRPVDGRSDLFSLGCVMYHLLTGRLPFPASNKIASMAMRVEGRADPMGAGLPSGLEGVVGRLMEVRPEDRYRCGAAAAEALQAPAA
jgi:serine/threonine protein kinase